MKTALNRGSVDFFPAGPVDCDDTASEAVACTGASAATVAHWNCEVVEVVSTVDAWILVAASPTAAVNTGRFLPAKTPRQIIVPADARIACIKHTGAADGTVVVTPARVSVP